MARAAARIRGIDIVWLLFLGALAALGLTKTEHSLYEWLALFVLGALQVAEGNLGWSDSPQKASTAIGVKLALCYLLVWATGGIESSYYLIFLLPIVSGASLFGLKGSLLTAAVSSGLYLSFVLFVLESYYVPPEGQRELTVRVLFFFLSAILVNRLATENRLKTRRLSQAYEELSQAQAEVRRAERLAALGQLSAGLAHEIRNPLGVISASAELLSKKVSGVDDVSREMADYIRSEVGRANALVTRFLDFARPSTPHRAVGQLNDVVRRAVTSLEEGSPGETNDFRVVAEYGELPRFSFDATLIESSVFNLLLNAREAMEQGGEVRIRTSREGDSVSITVSDDGPGIPPDKLEDVFNPFFTTKPTGVGLGLAMVSKFVDSHGGAITVENKSGGGATFRVVLPIQQDE